MKVTIDVEDLKKFYDALSEEKDEWYAPVNNMTIECILQFLEWSGKKKALKELHFYVYKNDET
jgi:hypothetical protein